jgi:DNA-binding transcriptional ArsR family regulator
LIGLLDRIPQIRLLGSALVGSTAERFEALVDGSGDHHVWLGAVDAEGTPQVRVDGRLTTARRVAWHLAHGPIPAGVRIAACVFLEVPSHQTYGLEVIRRTHLKSGTVYPLLDRLESMGWVTSRWEDVDPASEGRPRRRLYSLTAEGVSVARQVLREYGIAPRAWEL